MPRKGTLGPHFKTERLLRAQDLWRLTQLIWLMLTARSLPAVPKDRISAQRNFRSLVQRLRDERVEYDRLIVSQYDEMIRQMDIALGEVSA